MPLLVAAAITTLGSSLATPIAPLSQIRDTRTVSGTAIKASGLQAVPARRSRAVGPPRRRPGSTVSDSQGGAGTGLEWPLGWQDDLELVAMALGFGEVDPAVGADGRGLVVMPGRRVRGPVVEAECQAAQGGEGNLPAVPVGDLADDRAPR